MVPTLGQFDKVELLRAPHTPGDQYCQYYYSGSPGGYPFIWGQTAAYPPPGHAGFNVNSCVNGALGTCGSGGLQSTTTTFDAETCSSLGGCLVAFKGTTMKVKGGDVDAQLGTPCTTQLTFYDATF